jgi:hypothetical protein
MLHPYELCIIYFCHMFINKSIRDMRKNMCMIILWFSYESYDLTVSYSRKHKRLRRVDTV